MALIDRSKYSLMFERQINDKLKEGYVKYTPEYKDLAKVIAAPAGREYQTFVTSGIGMPRELAEGAGVEFDDFKEGNRQFIYYTTYGLGFQVTWQMVQDAIFKEAINDMATSLGEMHAFRKDLDFWRLFAEANATTYRKGPDGLAVCANNHVTIKSGQTINNLASAALADTSLQTAFEYALGAGASGNYLVAENGLPLRLTFDTLLVGPQLAIKAMQLLNQMYGVVGTSPFTAASNYNENTMNPKNGYVSPYKVKSSLALGQLLQAGSSIAKSWFLVDSKNLKAVILNKQDYTTKSWEDDRSGNLSTKGFMRYGMGWLDYKAVYGSFSNT